MNHKLPERASFLTLIILALAAPLFAADAVNKDKAGLALDGYDPVAYFTVGKPVEGKKAYEHEWMNARWRFSSVANRELFAKDPQRYAPQYGGYCAYAVSRDYTADADPNAWRIVGGKLYLNYNVQVREMWSKKTEDNIRKGDANWPGVLKKETKK